MNSLAIPNLIFLSQEQIEYVHTKSLEILSRTGVRVDSPRARQIFADADGARFLAQDRVTMEAGLVEWAIQSAPEVVDLYSRRGELAFRLGYDRTRFGAGVTNLYYQDPADDCRVTPFTRQNMASSVCLANQLPHFDVVSTIGIIQDYPPETADLYAALEMGANTTKPLVLLVSNEKLFGPVLDLLENLHGDLGKQPFLLPYFNPITPLVLNEATADKMLEAIERGLPVICSNYSMAGMSTPITAAGTLVLMNAELLACLTLAQLARPGTPVVLGSLPAFFDMRTMQDFYDPHTLLVNLACAEMMAYYHLPHAGTSGSGAGWGTDLVGGGMQWLNHLTSLLGKSGLAPFVGGNLGSKAFSPTLLVYANDVIGQALRFAQGFALDDEHLDLAEIERRGPGGSFLEADLTMQLYKRAYYESKLAPHWSLEKWQAQGMPRIEDRLRQQTIQMMESAHPPEDHDEWIGRGESFIQS